MSLPGTNFYVTNDENWTLGCCMWDMLELLLSTDVYKVSNKGMREDDAEGFTVFACVVPVHFWCVW